MSQFRKLGPVFELKLSAFVGFQHPPDRSKVERYRRELRKGAKFPPIEVVWRSPFWGGGWEVLDGHHRYHAHRLEGRKTIRCRVAELDLLNRPRDPRDVVRDTLAAIEDEVA